MSTAITATLIAGPHILGPATKVAFYKLAFPTSWALAGVALDLSADFTYVQAMLPGVSGAVDDWGYTYDLIGTHTANGVLAAGLSVVLHWCTATATANAGVANSTNTSHCSDMIVMVFGS